jgi:periplasmic mercuric ion binding protein
MKQFIASLFIVAGLVVATPSIAAERTVKLTVENMNCISCPYIVKNSLRSVQGVSHAEVSYEEKVATIIFDDKLTTVTALTEATAKAGFPSFLIKGNTSHE